MEEAKAATSLLANATAERGLRSELMKVTERRSATQSAQERSQLEKRIRELEAILC